jgi:hypothetical protein
VLLGGSDAQPASEGRRQHGWRRGDVVGLASAEEGLRARGLGLGWSGGQHFLGGNVIGIDQGFSPMVVETCMGQRDRARVLGLACVREIRGTKERGMSSRF